MEDEKTCRVGGMYESNLLLGKAPDYYWTPENEDPKLGVPLLGSFQATKRDPRFFFKRKPVFEAVFIAKSHTSKALVSGFISDQKA